VRHGRCGAALVALALVLGATACSGDDSGDAEQFCVLIRTNRDLLLGVSVEPEATSEALAVYDQVVDVAPRKIRKDAETIRTLFEELEDLDFTDDAAFGKAFEKLFNSDVRNASERFTDYVDDECAVKLRTGPITVTTVAGTPPTT